MEIKVGLDRSLDAYKVKETDKDELINNIIDAEWTMFDEVENIDGRADCQDDGRTFYIMRYSGHSCLTEITLSSYYEDIQEAVSAGRNLIAEKYAYMMKVTDPEYFRTELESELPLIMESKQRLVDEIVGIIVSSEKRFVSQYPYFSRASRPAENDIDGIISVKIYAEGEYKTYSEKTLKLCLEDLKSMLINEGIGPSFAVHDRMVRFYGYKGMEDAEEHMKNAVVGTKY